MSAVTTIVLSKMVAESLFNIDVVGFEKDIMLYINKEMVTRNLK